VHVRQGLGAAVRSRKIALLMVLCFASTHPFAGFFPWRTASATISSVCCRWAGVALTTGNAPRYRQMTSPYTRRSVASVACPSAESRNAWLGTGRLIRKNGIAGCSCTKAPWSWGIQFQGWTMVTPHCLG
jgi:hypothetical protein